MDRGRGIKKSNFPAQSTIPDGATLDFVVNNTNIKITKADFLAALGVTGTIEQVGDVTGTPVLDPQGTVNNIRNLENGPGFKASVSPQNGITVEHNFIVDAVGIPVMKDSSALQPTLRSILSGSGINVTQSGMDQIVISTSGTPVSIKTVLITQASDFPTAVAGVITLAADTDYLIANDVSVADRFVMSNNTQLKGVGAALINLTYTGVGIMFTSVDNGLSFTLLTCTAVTGTMFDITSTVSTGLGTVSGIQSAFVCQTLGNIHCKIFSILEGALIATVEGISTTGANMDFFSILNCSWTQTAGTCVDLGSTVFEAVDIRGVFGNFSSGVTGISGLTNSGNITAGGEGIIAANRFVGVGFTSVSGVDPDDDRWFFLSNNTVRDTIRDGLLSIQANATETVIGTQSVGVKAAGTFTVGRNSGFTPDTTGRVTYDLIPGIVVPISASVTLKSASGGSINLSAALAVNGTVIAESAMGTEASSSTEANISLTWQAALDAGDFIEIFVINNDNTVNIVVIDAILRVQ